MNKALRTFAKSACVRHPQTVNAFWKWYYLNFRYNGEKPKQLSHQSETPERSDIFESIYSNNNWKNSESVSGFGSTIYNTTIVRRELPKIISDYNVKTLLDAPCGDFNWMSRIVFPKEFEYIGCDIVPDLIKQIRTIYTQPNRRFEVLDIVEGPIPHADMWLCRDTLFHLSFVDSLRCLENAARSGVKFFLTTSYDFVDHNNDIDNGEFRFINLCKPPYSLPPPIYKIDDYLAPNPPRILGMWTHEQLSSRFI